jgi:hypothetical protein
MKQNWNVSLFIRLQVFASQVRLAGQLVDLARLSLIKK